MIKLQSVPIDVVPFPVSKQLETFKAYQFDPSKIDSNVTFVKSLNSYFVNVNSKLQPDAISPQDYIMVSDFDGHLEVCPQALFGKIIK